MNFLITLFNKLRIKLKMLRLRKVEDDIEYFIDSPFIHDTLKVKLLQEKYDLIEEIL